MKIYETKEHNYSLQFTNQDELDGFCDKLRGTYDDDLFKLADTLQHRGSDKYAHNEIGYTTVLFHNEIGPLLSSLLTTLIGLPVAKVQSDDVVVDEEGTALGSNEPIDAEQLAKEVETSAASDSDDDDNKHGLARFKKFFEH